MVAACSNDPDRPTDDDLTRVFASKNSPFGMPLPKEQAACIADAYADSGLSTTYLKALAKGATIQPDKDDLKKIDELQAKIAANCIT